MFFTALPSNMRSEISLVACWGGCKLPLWFLVFTVKQKAAPSIWSDLTHAHPPSRLTEDPGQEGFGSECTVNTFGKHPLCRVRALRRLKPDVMQLWHHIWTQPNSVKNSIEIDFYLWTRRNHMWDTWAQSKSKSEPNSRLSFTYLWQPLSTYPTVPLRHINSNAFFSRQHHLQTWPHLQPAFPEAKWIHLEGFAPRYCWRGAVYFIFLAGTYGYISRSLSWALVGNDSFKLV